MYFILLIVKFSPIFFICWILFIHSLISLQINTFWSTRKLSIFNNNRVYEGGAQRKVNIKFQPKNTIGNLRGFWLTDCHMQRETTIAVTSWKCWCPLESALVTCFGRDSCCAVASFQPSTWVSALGKKNLLDFKVSLNLCFMCLIVAS